MNFGLCANMSGFYSDSHILNTYAVHDLNGLDTYTCAL